MANFAPSNLIHDVLGGNKKQNKKTMEQELLRKLEAIERNSLLAAKKVFCFDDVVLLTGLSRSHLYKLNSTNKIPHYKPHGKNVYFDRAEVEDWMRQNRVATQAEAEQQAIAYTVRKGGKI